MPGDRGLIQDVRPASAEVTGQQRELFAFDAFEYEDPNKIAASQDAKITLKTGWKFDLQRADITGSLDMLGQGAIQSENYVEDFSGWRIDSTSIEIDEGTFRGDITGGTISIGGTPGSPNFSVDSDGNMVAVGGTFGGAVNLGTADFTTTGNISVTNITASNSISVTAGNISATGNITATGNLAGANFFAMNQDVRTTDAVTFSTVNTGQGNNNLHPMNQGVRTTDNVTFSTVNARGIDTFGGFYTGSSSGATNLPVGSIVSVITDVLIGRNAVISIVVSPNFFDAYEQGSVSGITLAGTWRSRGILDTEFQIGGSFRLLYLAQRVS